MNRVLLIGLRAIPGVVLSLAATVATAQVDTWGWAPPPALSDGAIAELTEAWQHDDGSRGHILALGAGHEFAVERSNRDHKLIVIQGQLLVAGNHIRATGYAALPAADTQIVTCASQSDCLIYLETEPTQKITQPHIVPAAEIPWFDVPNTGGMVSLAWVWGDAETPDPSSFFLRFQPGFPGFQHAHTHGYQGVVLQGDYVHWEPADPRRSNLSVGTTFWQHGGAAHDDACSVGTGEPCIAYFRIENSFDVFPAD